MWAATVCGSNVAIDHPLVLKLSRLMRSGAPATALTSERFRNPHGVARKIWRYRDLLEGRRNRPLSWIEENVWREFADDRRGLAAEAARVRRRLAAAPDLPDCPSRGPVPAAFSTDRGAEGPSWVYVAGLEGTAAECGRIFVKVGHSNDTRRREADLNFGLPRRLGLRWLMIASWRMRDGTAAYRAEQAILQSEAIAGRCAGGEFLLIAADGVDGLLLRCRRIIRLSSLDATRKNSCPDGNASSSDQLCLGRPSNRTDQPRFQRHDPSRDISSLHQS